MRNFEWQLRFAALIHKCHGRKFAWGAFDCAVFAAESVEAVTGRNVLPELVYASEKEALRHLQKTSLRELAGRALGEEVAPALAQIGDIGLSDQEGEAMLVVCVGRCWMAPSRSGGLLVAPTPAVVWRCAKV